MRFAFLLLTFAFLTAGCKTTADSPAENETSQNVPTDMQNGILATVKYIDLEGGFYGIQAEDGENYYPINLAEEYREDGLRIVFKVKPRPDIMTTVMWGKTVEIVEIVRR